jgi:ribosomal protein L12E/L44/L45/RPP1/RPP2
MSLKSEETKSSDLLAIVQNYNNKMLDEKMLKYRFNFTTCKPMDADEIKEKEEKKEAEEKIEKENEEKKEKEYESKTEENFAAIESPTNPGKPAKKTTKLVFSFDKPLTLEMKEKLMRKIANKPFIL